MSLASVLLLVAAPLGWSDTGKAGPGASTRRWREISRNASKALWLKKFTEAAAGYEEAIATISATSANCESLLNLKMNLAEVRRQQGLLKDATLLLDSVQTEIKQTPPLDPFLQARYWRGRSRLQESLKLYEDGANSAMKAFEIALPHFAPHSGHTFTAYSRLVYRLCELNGFNLILEVMSRVDKTYEPTSKQHAKLTSSFQTTFSKFCNWASDIKDLVYAEKQLAGLCKVYKDLPVLLRSCRTWFDTCKRVGARVAYDDIATNLQATLQRERPSAENILVLIDGRCLVVDLYRKHHQQDVVQDQLRKCEGLLSSATKLRVASKKREPLQKAIMQLQTDLNQMKKIREEDK